MRFKCGACNNFVEKQPDTPKGFAGWAYSGNTVEWLAQGEEIPPLESRIWLRREMIPKTGELCAVKVRLPFDEDMGGEFWAEFLQPNYYLSGDESDETVGSSAIVRCRLESAAEIGEYAAWVMVRVLEAVPYAAVCEAFAEFAQDEGLDRYCGFGGEKICDETEFETKSFRQMFWTMEGDVGEKRLIFTDKQGREHLVLLNFYTFHEDYTYFGNIVDKK